jgi:hypothetical protein
MSDSLHMRFDRKDPILGIIIVGCAIVLVVLCLVFDYDVEYVGLKLIVAVAIIRWIIIDILEIIKIL